MTGNYSNHGPFHTLFDILELFNIIEYEFEGHSSIVKTKFKNNLHRVSSFEHLKKALGSAKSSAENNNLRKSYTTLVENYNIICKNLN